MKAKNKLEKVTVIRYARAEDEEREIHNLGGVTFLFDMDYNKRLVDVSLSVCSKKENFSKKKAIEAARMGGVVRTLPLNNFQKIANEEGGFVDGYVSILKALDRANNIDLVDALDSREKMLLKKCHFDRYDDMRIEYLR